MQKADTKHDRDKCIDDGIPYHLAARKLQVPPKPGAHDADKHRDDNELRKYQRTRKIIEVIAYPVFISGYNCHTHQVGNNVPQRFLNFRILCHNDLD